ncbi:MAG: DUF4872 domain-containing protein [Gemmatimonadaceae bacterium]
MTEQSDFKGLVRERMLRTGERYTTARAHVVDAHRQAAADPALALGGVHDQTAALRDLLVAAGIDVPHTNAPPSEALLLGLGGGIGAAVFTFQYQGHLPHLYVETRCTPQFAYDMNFIERAATGLGLSLEIATGTTPNAAANALDGALNGGKPALCLVDALKLPHHAGRIDGGSLPWVVVVHEQRDDMVIVTDRSQVTLTIPRTALDVARASYKKGKNAVATLRRGKGGDLKAGVRTGIAYCVAELTGREVKKGFAGNFGLRAIEKWIGEISRSGKDGWRQRFAPGKPLAAGLCQAYGWIETSGTGGSGFRRMYAEFLRECATITGNQKFVSVAARYDAVAEQWTSLFTSLLPEGTPLGEMRRVLHERSAGIRRGESGEQLRERDRAFDALVAACDPFPVDAEATYVGLAEGLSRLLEGERAAAAALREAAS